ncbi:MAG: hypothetical protein QXD61_11535 [Candidatus Caldarchaeum sp.]
MKKRSSRTMDVEKPAATAGLLLLDAMVFHEVAARMDSRIPTLANILAAPNTKKSLEEVWTRILQDVDYEPIFEIAVNILQSLPASPFLDEQLRQLLNTAYDIAASRVLLRHDLFGRVYHQLLLGKLVKYYATYYTSIPAARLLARLLVNLPSPLRIDTIPPRYGGQELRVVDFACGSGTLLSAIYKELDVKHRLDSDMPAVLDLHRYLIEEGLWGFDVLHHAVHLAATVIFMHNPTPVSHSRLYALRLEKAGNDYYLGSLNFFKDNQLKPAMVLSGGTPHGITGVSVQKLQSESLELPNFHLCIMNPPFTRSVGGNLLFGALPKRQRTQLQEKLAVILKEEGLSGIGQAGLGAVFVFLADKYLTPRGRLGLVLPRTVLSGVSWQAVREKLLKDYHVECIITSYQGDDNWNFSENTSLSEVLLVARKLESGQEPGYTYFLNLWLKPSNELESIHVGTQMVELYKQDVARLYDIENSNASPYHLKLHGKKVGEAYSAKLADTEIGVYNFFAQMELNRVVTLMRQGTVYIPGQGIGGRLSLTSLSNLGTEIGPDRRQVHNAFQKSDLRQGCLYKAFWEHDSDRVRTIRQLPNACLEHKDLGSAGKLWNKSGRLLIVERVWLPTYRVFSVFVEEPVLSNVWWPVKIDDMTGKILSLWLNSTYGLLLLLSKSEVTRGPLVGLKKTELINVPVLDLTKVDNFKKDSLLKCYENFCRREFEPLPKEFAAPQTRREIDEKLNEILEIKGSLDGLYKLLAADPMITNRAITASP